MKLLLIAIACALTGCSLDTVDDTPILLRHRGGDRVDADAGTPEADAGLAGQAGVAGAQAGSGSLGGSGQGGASGAAGQPQGGAPSAGSGGASAGSAGLGSTAGAAGASGSAGLAGSAGAPAGGSPGGQGGVAGSSGAGAAGVAGSTIDYFQGCQSAPSWQPEWDGGSTATAEYVAGIPLHGQILAACGIFTPGIPVTDVCLWVCHDAALCRQFPPDGSVHQTLDNENAWGSRPYCDCLQPGNNCYTAPH